MSFGPLIPLESYRVIIGKDDFKIQLRVFHENYSSVWKSGNLIEMF